jgi:hypothetical protein
MITTTPVCLDAVENTFSPFSTTVTPAATKEQALLLPLRLAIR